MYPDQSYSSDHWIVDTGATDHITLFPHLLQNVTEFHSVLHLPNGATAEVTQMGSVMLSTDIILQNVLCVPSFAYNLLSVSKLLKDVKCVATFTSTQCSIQALGWNTTIEIGKQLNGLYLLSQTKLCQHQHHSGSSKSQSVACTATTTQILLWHYRLGHVPSQVLKLLPFDDLKMPDSPCDSCILAKQTRYKFHVSQSVSDSIFELVHMDLWGPYRHKTHDNCTMFLTIVDAKSRATWIYLVADKSQVASLFKSFFSFVENQFSTTIKIVRSDNGSEFLDKSLASYFADKGVLH